MNDSAIKSPPDDRTILVPRPGGKPATKSASAPVVPKPTQAGAFSDAPLPNNAVDNDRTIAPSFASQRLFRQGGIPGIGANVILDAAAIPLSLIGQIRNTSSHQDVKVLHQQCIELVREFEHNLRNKQIEQDTLYSARYCLCAILDETVLNTPWGGNSFWGMESLLSAYHKETLGGEHFFNILEEAIGNPQKHIDLLEFQYTCLSLGFEGKLRLEERGSAKLDDLRDRVFRVIRDAKGEYERELSPCWESDGTNGDGLVEHLPVWVIAAIFGALLLTSFMLFRYNLNQQTQQNFSTLYSLVKVDEASDKSSPLQKDKLLHLQQLLQSEIERGYLTVVEAPQGIVIRFKSENLFPSASAMINESFLPILKKVALTLESIEGKITVTGHTDDVSIFSYQFRSNFELSLERANSVVRVMKENAQLSSRIISQGKADMEPLVPNDSEQNRSLNRRVEVSITED